ncbi:MAG: lytic transglycosylase domain-containing protein [Actinomycetota bacterium]|nr:lytic transglycosylase domain-containing protein [Actinomycetota bacterium]
MLRRSTAAALATVIFLVAACSDGDRPAEVASERTTTTTTTTAAPDPPTSAASPTTSTTSVATTAGPVTTVGSRYVSPLPEGTPTSVAEALAVTEPAIRDPATPVADLERHGRAQQVAYRQLAIHPEWTDEVLRRVPAALGGVVRANAGAGSELRALTKPQTALPPWRIVAPAPADELLGYYKAAESAIGAPWNYLAAIHLVETRMGRIRGTSTAGAQGPMQFLPATWRQYGAGGDINSNRDSIFAAARLLVRNGAPGNMANALFNYNRSQRYVRAVTAYAELMAQDEGAYRGYYHWQVFYRTTDGDRLLAEGYGT